MPEISELLRETSEEDDAIVAAAHQRIADAKATLSKVVRKHIADNTDIIKTHMVCKLRKDLTSAGFTNIELFLSRCEESVTWGPVEDNFHRTNKYGTRHSLPAILYTWADDPATPAVVRRVMFYRASRNSDGYYDGLSTMEGFQVDSHVQECEGVSHWWQSSKPAISYEDAEAVQILLAKFDRKHAQVGREYGTFAAPQQIKPGDLEEQLASIPPYLQLAVVFQDPRTYVAGEGAIPDAVFFQP